MSIILSADIGGTKTNLRLSQFEFGALSILKQKQYKSADWPTFDILLEDFIDDSSHSSGHLDSACFAVAGPLQHLANNTIVNVTNLPWKLDRQSLDNKFNLPQLSLINDFQAIGHCVDLLEENDLFTLQQGGDPGEGLSEAQIRESSESSKNNGNTNEFKRTRAFIGAGTGLGQAISVFNGLDFDVISTEGGHCDYAPNSDFEIALYQFLNQKYDHVSYERLLSGEGLHNIYQFFSHICQPTENSIYENEKMLTYTDKALAISQLSAQNPDGLASRTMDLFFKIYGAQCGNLALNCLPTDGLYIAGGIAQKNLEFMKKSAFLSCFNAKGRMRQLMENTSVKVITTENAGLLGATNVALKQLFKKQKLSQEQQLQKH